MTLEVFLKSLVSMGMVDYPSHFNNITKEMVMTVCLTKCCQKNR
jgi:hypothetical protein